ncbi:TATA box-binding protein-associated factor RNA polymerase I subunit B isoform X2 [Eleutherodactylus coqui]
MQSICRGLRKKKRALKGGWEWYICEGFQFILLKQAEALEDLGIGPDIKDNMCNLWRLYLQETQQAYCETPADRKLRVHYATSEADADMDQLSQSSLGVPSSGVSSSGVPSSGVPSEASGDQSDTSGHGGASGTSDAESAVSMQSLGSVDGSTYKKKKGRIMSMPMTLAFCYLAILWVRASITLSDLLRLVFYRHIPYYNPQQYFPENTQLYGPDIHLFGVENFPLYDRILDMTRDLGCFLRLPLFPPITETTYCHPYVLCMKYLMEVNLPDELHYWTCSVAKQARLDEVAVLTFKPADKNLVRYDIQAVAIIVVALKLVFALNDDFEWQLAKRAQRANRTETDVPMFDFEKWYMTIRPCLDEACRRLEDEKAKFIWDSERVLAYNSNSRVRLLKRTRMEKNLQSRFSKLASAAPDAGNRRPSSFFFNWEELNTDKICFHGHSLEGIAQKDQKEFCSFRKKYWLSTVKKCKSEMCQHWKLYGESQLPSSYHFIISLFSTILGVEHTTIHYNVCMLEHKLVSQKLRKKAKQHGRSNV